MSDGTIQEKNLEAEIYSAPIAAQQLDYVVNRKADQIRTAAQFITDHKPKRIIFTASGASWCTLYSGHYVMDSYSGLPSYLYFGPELQERDPEWLNDDCVAVLASYSGQTRDTVETCAFLQNQGIPTVSICRDADGPLGSMTDQTITYESKCLYTSPLAAVVLLAACLLETRQESLEQARKIQHALKGAADQMDTAAAASKTAGEEIAARIVTEQLTYFMAGGPLYSLGYQVAYTWVMEYLRRDSAFLHHGEFRHGPLEVLNPGHPCTIHLIGTDAGRDYAETTYQYCLAETAQAIRIDARSFFETHPVLNPLVVFNTLNYMLFFAANSLAVDLDEYLQMHIKPYIPGETYF